jgi:glycosyltransferase involved in cell wall biosynthesis
MIANESDMQFEDTRPLRIVIDARMSDGLSGGVQQWVIGLAKALSRLTDDTEDYVFLVDEGHEAWLTPYVDGRCSMLVQPVALLAPPVASRLAKALSRARGALAARFPFLRTLRRRLVSGERARWLSPLHRTITNAGANVMHFTTQSAFATTVPSIYQPWDLQHLHLPEFFSVADRQGREVAYRAFCAQASLVVVATNWVKADVSAQYGIEPERIAVVNPPPVTTAYVPPTPEQTREIASRLGLPSRYVFYPAQTWGHKNHERLLEALRQLRDQGIEVPLVCSGHRNERHPAVMHRAAELGLENQVMFLGFLDPAAIQVIYQRATALIFPSLYEGWGLPVLEAFAADLPVACSNATSLPELVGDAAILFDPLDPDAIAMAVRRVWVDDALRAGLIERGRERLGQFDWHRTALLMRAHYRRIAGRQLDALDSRLIAAAPLV